MRPYIFLSYSHATEDTSIVEKFASKLSTHGIKFFRDTQSIRYGDNIPNTVKEALERTTHFIPFISPASDQSQWVFFEIGIAYSLSKRIIPRLLHSKMNLPIFLGNARYMSSVEDEDKFVQELLLSLRVMTGKLIRKDEESSNWGQVQPTTGEWATFKPEDLLAPLTIAELEVGETLMFEESPRVAGGRSRYVTNIRRINNIE